MWFLVIFLLVVIAVCAYLIFDQNRVKKNYKKYSTKLQESLVVATEKEAGLHEQVHLLKGQIEDLKNQRASFDRMVKLGLLTVVDTDIKKQLKLDEESPKEPTDNVVYIGRHA